MTQVKANQETITPELAVKMLATMGSNRSLSETVVSRYTSDMKSGRWQSNNGQTLVFDENDELRDGQHRLNAIIRSGTSHDFLVVRGVASATFETIDNGRMRTAGDVLGLKGYKHGTATAAISRMSYAYNSGLSLGFAPGRMSVIRYAEAHPYVAELADALRNKKHRFPVGPLGAVMALANEDRTRDDLVADFIDGVVSGVGLQRGDPRLALREWEATERMRSRGVLHSESAFGAAARAWNAWVNNRELIVIKSVGSHTRLTLNVAGYDETLFQDVPDLTQANAERIRQFGRFTRRPVEGVTV